MSDSMHFSHILRGLSSLMCLNCAHVGGMVLLIGIIQVANKWQALLGEDFLGFRSERDLGLLSTIECPSLRC